MQLLIQISGAKRILEIGTLGAYSTIWMADAVPAGGMVHTIECNPHYAHIARQNLKVCGHDERVEVLTGDALQILPTLHGPYDFFFIDADKPNNPAYLQWALRLARPSAVIVADNVVRGGEVTSTTSDDERVMGVRAFLKDVSRDTSLSATALQTTGEKGWDGFCLIRVGQREES